MEIRKNLVEKKIEKLSRNFQNLDISFLWVS